MKVRGEEVDGTDVEASDTVIDATFRTEESSVMGNARGAERTQVN